MPEIDNLHDNFFRKVLAEDANAETFLKVVLPEDLQNRLDFAALAFDPTSYVSAEYKSSFSDMVIKCRTKGDEQPVDIYFLLEHKSYPDKGIFLQLLRYMHLMWQKDEEEKKTQRMIVPVVFYHGKGAWQFPTQFIEQFPVTEEWKRYALNFTYILFDTNVWDWQAESNRPLRENVYLLSAMLLMKAAFNKDLELIRQVFHLWHQMGFVKEKERIVFLMVYIMETQETPIIQLEKMLEETKLQGEEAMPTIAQRLRDEGKEQGILLGEQQGIEKGMEKGYLLARQDVLIMLLSTRFQLSENEKQFIHEVNEIDKLTTALKLFVTAQTKEDVLVSLKTAVQ